MAVAAVGVSHKPKSVEILAPKHKGLRSPKFEELERYKRKREDARQIQDSQGRPLYQGQRRWRVSRLMMAVE